MGDRDTRGRWDSLPPFGEDGHLNVVIETPKACRNKFKFDPDLGVFRLNKVLPAGMVFPFDFGYVPGTLADDGDPSDVLVLMDEPAFPGCIVFARLLGIVEALQRDADSRKEERNDRIIAVAASSREHADVGSLDDLPKGLVSEIEEFFADYHRQDGGRFKAIGRGGPKKALALIRDAARAAKRGAKK